MPIMTTTLIKETKDKVATTLNIDQTKEKNLRKHHLARGFVADPLNVLQRLDLNFSTWSTLYWSSVSNSQQQHQHNHLFQIKLNIK